MIQNIVFDRLFIFFIIFTIIRLVSKKPQIICKNHDNFQTTYVSRYTQYARMNNLKKLAYIPNTLNTYVSFPANTILYVQQTKKKNGELWLKVYGNTIANYPCEGWIKYNKL